MKLFVTLVLSTTVFLFSCKRQNIQEAKQNTTREVNYHSDSNSVKANTQPLVKNGIIDVAVIEKTPSKGDTVLIDQVFSSTDNKQLLLKFYSFLKKQSISISDFEDIFGSYLVEEEELFFSKCLKTNNEKYCSELFNNCITSKDKCESLIFKEIIKYKEVFLLGKNYDFVKTNYLDKIKNTDNFVKIEKTKFIFSKSENLNSFIISDIRIDNKSLFKSIWEGL